MSTNQIIKHYVNFLNKSYNDVIPLINNRSYSASNEESLFSWFQLNWEFLVERKLLKNFNDYLYPYGYGADWHGNSDRVIDPDGVYNYKIYLNPINNDKIKDHISGEFIKINKTDFFIFVSIKDGWYFYEPNFKYVLLENDIVVNLSDVKFTLEKIN